MALETEIVMGEDWRQVLWRLGQVIRWRQRCYDHLAGLHALDE